MLPIALSVFLQDWLVQQSLYVWTEALQPYAPILALWLCIEAIYLVRAPSRPWHACLPGPWLALLYWQLQCLQSGVFDWPFLMQLLGVAIVMALVTLVATGFLRAARWPALVSFAGIQWLLAWALMANWPARSGGLVVDGAEAVVAVSTLAVLTALGVVFEPLRWRFASARRAR